MMWEGRKEMTGAEKHERGGEEWEEKAEEEEEDMLAVAEEEKEGTGHIRGRGRGGSRQ
jgi:hypothetical protein